jgi:hypothetical protein
MKSKSSMMKALVVYVAVSWAIIQVIDVLAQNLGLPGWAFSYALILLAIGFPIVGVTAFLNGLEVRHGNAGEEREGARKVFRWRNALAGGVAAGGVLTIGCDSRIRKQKSVPSRHVHRRVRPDLPG